MEDTFRIGLVGCGRVAERGYLPACARARGLRLVALADRSAGRCERLAPDLPRYPSARALIEGEQLDGIILATPAAAHLDDARLATDAGLAVLVEKPPAPDGADAALLAALQPAPYVGFNRRFDPQVQRLRGAVPASGRLDLTLSLERRSDAWDAYEVKDDLLLSHGTHLLDLARWLSRSEIVSARALALDYVSAVVELELERGRALVSCATGGRARDAIEIRDGSGSPVARLEPLAALRRLEQRLRGGTALVRLLVAQLEAFAAAATETGAGVLATAADGLAVMAAVDAARRSAAHEAGSVAVEAPRADLQLA